MSSSQSSIEANPNNASIKDSLGNSLRLLQLSLQLKLTPWSSGMLGALEATAHAFSQMAELSLKVVKVDGANMHIPPVVLKPVPDDADPETRQEILEMNLFYIDRSFTQTLPLIGDDPSSNVFFAQLGQLVEVLAPKALMMYRETLAEREAAFDELSELAKQGLDLLQQMEDDYTGNPPPF